MKRVGVLLRTAPYGSVYAAEGYRAIMGLGVFEMEVVVIFMDDGVYNLVKGQNPVRLEMKPLGEGFPMLPDFEVNRFYAHDVSLAERGLSTDDLVMDVEVADSAGIANLLESCDAILPF